MPSTHHGLHSIAACIKQAVVFQGNAEKVYRLFVHVNTFMMQKETRETVEILSEHEVKVQHVVL
jgi:hypothetical protein